VSTIKQIIRITILPFLIFCSFSTITFLSLYTKNPEYTANTCFDAAGLYIKILEVRNKKYLIETSNGFVGYKQLVSYTKFDYEVEEMGYVSFKCK